MQCLSLTILCIFALAAAILYAPILQSHWQEQSMRETLQCRSLTMEEQSIQNASELLILAQSLIPKTR